MWDPNLDEDLGRLCLAGEDMALRALTGLSDQIGQADGMESPLTFKSAITMMSKAALCAWWHAKIMSRAQELTLLSVRQRREGIEKEGGNRLGTCTQDLVFTIVIHFRFLEAL